MIRSRHNCSFFLNVIMIHGTWNSDLNLMTVLNQLLFDQLVWSKPYNSTNRTLGCPFTSLHILGNNKNATTIESSRQSITSIEPTKSFRTASFLNGRRPTHLQPNSVPFFLPLYSIPSENLRAPVLLVEPCVSILLLLFDNPSELYRSALPWLSI